MCFDSSLSADISDILTVSTAAITHAHMHVMVMTRCQLLFVIVQFTVI